MSDKKKKNDPPLEPLKRVVETKPRPKDSETTIQRGARLDDVETKKGRD